MKKIGIVGLGAFGQLMARHLTPHFDVVAHDPATEAKTLAGVTLMTLPEVAKAEVIVLAVPVAKIREVAEALAPHLNPDALILDVGSVKMLPMKAMEEALPPTVSILGTHPMFGPQSAQGGLAGLKIALCPLRGDRTACVAAFLHDTLKLEVILTTPEEHDRAMAAAQGLTHMIAKVLVEMEPLPDRLTTRSFDLLMQAVGMVRDDSMDLFLAIQRDNPFAADLRHTFFAKAEELRKFLKGREGR